MTGGAYLAGRVDERIDELAPLARRLAPELCWRDPQTGEDCAWYHGPWQDFRRLGLVVSARINGDFFVETLRELARAGARRVLVSGCADQATLAHVLFAWRAAGAVPDVNVVDLCETPLAVCRAYAEREGVAIATHRSDILAFAPDRRFDVVCTHSFLTRLPMPRRPELLRKWRSFLVPEGVVVTAQRVRPSRSEQLVRHSPEEAREFAARALALARARAPELDVTPESIAAAALLYAQRRAREPVRTASELRALFEESGYTLLRFDDAGVEEMRRDALAGPPDAASRRMRIVARRGDDA